MKNIQKPSAIEEMCKPLNFEHSVEITEDAFWLLKQNDENTWHDYGQNEIAEWSIYVNKGVKILALTNFLSGVTQYYVQDINA